MSYSRVGRRSHGCGGFMVNSKRFSVQGIRARFLSRWRFLKSLIKRQANFLITIKKKKKKSRRPSVETCIDCSSNKRFGRSNSFYSEAIADCLEFIRRSSISVDHQNQHPLSLTHIQ